MATLLSEPVAYHVLLEPDSSVDYPRTLRDDVARALGHGERHVIIDCHKWRQLDLRMLSALVRCARACCEIGAGLELVNLRDHLRADLRELRLDARLGVRA
ncbi:MAG TPA: STAS domain-containing protein [Gemmatimonadaceae bacterium]|jgi:anti-anti-sigma regulatory factor|nr:STAS domain-containing protein [Gemmatimonadaceae bacterium]